jgi:hypothetical protein
MHLGQSILKFRDPHFEALLISFFRFVGHRLRSFLELDVGGTCVKPAPAHETRDSKTLAPDPLLGDDQLEGRRRLSNLSSV